MSRLAYLTPETEPDPPRQITLWVPGGEDWEALARGALASLLLESNWEQTQGGLTPEETIAYFASALLTTFSLWG